MLENTINNQEVKILSKFREYQSMPFAIIGGFGVCLICAYLWAAIMVITNYQVGIIAIGLGLAVGFAVRYFGAGVDYSYSIVGAGLAFLGCMLGNLFAQIGFISQAQSLSYLDVVMLLDLSIIKDIMVESFSPMDLIFYAIAAYEGFKFAIRPVEDSDLLDFSENKLDATPPLHSLRMPLAVGCFVAIVFLSFLSSGSKTGEQTFYYEDGSVMSTGNYIDGLQDGEWKYYHTTGEQQAMGSYITGLEEGQWNYFDSLGQKIKSIDYMKGMSHGTYMTYNNGTVIDSGRFHLNREVGRWISKHDNGMLASSGNFERGKTEGDWQFYQENGLLSSQGSYKSGNQDGAWKHYDLEGELLEEVVYKEGELDKVMYVKEDGKELVVGGNGYYSLKYDNGNISSEGLIKDGKFDGIWKGYYLNGDMESETQHIGEDITLLAMYDRAGDLMVKDGNGQVISTYDSGNLSQQGEIVNGKRHGTWMTYYDDPAIKSTEINYKNGVLDGDYMGYAYDGSMYVEGEYKDDLQVGLWKWYYLGGTPESEVNFIKGEKDGVQTFYNESGIEVKQEIYKNGKFLEEKILGDE